MTDERVEIYNRPATVERYLPTTSIVRWQDNGTQGFVPTERVDAALAALERELDGEGGQ